MKRYPTDANPPMKSKIAPEFVLVPPDLSPSVANIVQPLAAAGNVTNVDILQHREAQNVFEQFGREVGQCFSLGVGGNSIQSWFPLSSYSCRHLYCLPRLPHF